MNKFFTFLFAITLFIAGCNTNKQENSDEAKAPGKEINSESVVLIDMDVNGMTCTGCENTIKQGVSELPGVVSVQASHTDAKTYVKVDTSQTGIDQISKTISSKGYEVAGAAIGEDKDTASDDDNTSE